MAEQNTSPASFPRSRRIQKRGDFVRVQSKGRKAKSLHLLLATAPRAGATRLGITVTTKVHKRAVARNRLKRRLRETFRQTAPQLRPGFDLVVIALTGATELDFGTVQAEFFELLRKARLYLSPQDGPPGTLEGRTTR